MRRLDVGWPSSHPWSTTVSILGPAMLALLAFTLLSVGARKRILAGIAVAFGLAVVVCGIVALVN